MKKRTVLALAAVLILVMLSGCGSSGDASLSGSYSVPEGWVKAESHSTDEKIFYVQEGQEEAQAPDNISVNYGTNNYSLDEHEQFREAILRQLLEQLDGVDAELKGDGTYTAHDYILYIFTIEEPHMVTKQYYILTDHGYCLVHLTDFTGGEAVYDAAGAIVDSFVWDEDK